MQSIPRPDLDKALKSEYVTIGGKRVHYVTAGSGAPVILLPGWPGCWRSMSGLMPKLASHYYVIALDMPGWGGESQPTEGMHDQDYYVRFLCEFIRTLRLAVVSLFGVSTGGSIALLFAKKYPTRVNKVIVQSPPYDDVYNLNHSREHFTLGFIYNHSLTRWLGEWFFKSWLNEWRYVNLTHPELKQVPKALLDACFQDIRKASGRAIAESGLSVLETDHTLDFRDVSTPVLVLTGDGDESVPVESTRKLADQVLPNARFEIIPEAQHLVVLVDPARLAEPALAFLQEPD